MISVGTGIDVGSIGVTTSDNGGLSSDQIAEMARKKIVYVSDDAPPAIKEQAQVFADRVEAVVRFYIDLAKREERGTICQTLRNAGHNDIADFIRRL
jgi:hypothetical protein|tara:strand:+ start:882 stop:1172 length:291 start_codon:yes stop_codon:yes gene_type:complete